MKRNDCAPSGLSEELVRARINWWMVGTAEYQVGRKSRTVRQKESGLKRAGTTTVPPERKVDSVEAMSP